MLGPHIIYHPVPSRQSVNIGLMKKKKKKDGILHPVSMDLIGNSQNVLGGEGEWIKVVIKTGTIEM